VQLLVQAQGSGNAEEARKGRRLIYLPEAGGMDEVPVYDRYRLGSGAQFSGPAIIEERESTLIIGPGGQGMVDQLGNIVVEVAG
jgi:N-methylhydantoinase A